MNRKNFTYGMELEFGDIRMEELPEGLSWNRKDYSIVSSTGIANDPKGLLYKKGGEINSVPTDITGQLALFDGLLLRNLGPQVNHRTNLHLHVGFPGLENDLESLKKILSYAYTHQEEIYSRIEPIPVPCKSDYKLDEEFKGAKKRYQRRKISHQFKVPKERVEKALNSSSVIEFLESHAPTDSQGKPAWGVTTRAGINLLQIKETQTVEFRHFTNTLDPEELRSCFEWVGNFMEAALEEAPLEQVFKAYDYKFPPFQPFNYYMEFGYKHTNFDKLARKTVQETLEKLSSHLNLEECSAEELHQVLTQIGF